MPHNLPGSRATHQTPRSPFTAKVGIRGETVESTDSQLNKDIQEIRGEVEQEILNIVRADNRSGAVNLDSMIVNIDEGEEYDAVHQQDGRPTESVSY